MGVLLFPADLDNIDTQKMTFLRSISRCQSLMWRRSTMFNKQAPISLFSTKATDAQADKPAEAEADAEGRKKPAFASDYVDPNLEETDDNGVNPKTGMFLSILLLSMTQRFHRTRTGAEEERLWVDLWKRTNGGRKARRMITTRSKLRREEEQRSTRGELGSGDAVVCQSAVDSFGDSSTFSPKLPAPTHPPPSAPGASSFQMRDAYDSFSRW